MLLSQTQPLIELDSHNSQNLMQNHLETEAAEREPLTLGAVAELIGEKDTTSLNDKQNGDSTPHLIDSDKAPTVSERSNSLQSSECISGGSSETTSQNLVNSATGSKTCMSSVETPALCEMTGHMRQFACLSPKLNMSFTVHIESPLPSGTPQQRCYILTVHDIGYDHEQFKEFVGCVKMRELRSRLTWLHVTLPGQEAGALDLTARKYPSMEDLADELVCVLDTLKVQHVVCMGEGVGANVAAYFSMKHASRCQGVVLIEPVASAASFTETIRYRLLSGVIGGVGASARLLRYQQPIGGGGNGGNSGSPLSGTLPRNNGTLLAAGKNLIGASETIGRSAGSPAKPHTPGKHRRGPIDFIFKRQPSIVSTSSETEKLNLKQLDETIESISESTASSSELTPSGVAKAVHSSSSNGSSNSATLPKQWQAGGWLQRRNTRNLTLFAEAFLNRAALVDKLRDLKVDALVCAGKSSQWYGEAKKCYKCLQEVHKRTPQKLVNSPFLELDNTTCVLRDAPDRLVTGFQYFLQGIGLIPTTPMPSVTSAATLLSPQPASTTAASSTEEAATPLSSAMTASASSVAATATETDETPAEESVEAAAAAATVEATEAVASQTPPTTEVQVELTIVDKPLIDTSDTVVVEAVAPDAPVALATASVAVDASEPVTTEIVCEQTTGVAVAADTDTTTTTTTTSAVVIVESSNNNSGEVERPAAPSASSESASESQQVSSDPSLGE